MFAIRSALKSARADVGVTETQEFRSPLTAERIRLAVCDELVKRSEVAPVQGKLPFFVAA